MSHASPDDVARRAYALWEDHGRPHGQDKEHWAQAERELAGADTADEVRRDDPPALAADEAPVKKVTRRAASKAGEDQAGGAAPKAKRTSRRAAAPADA